MITTPTHAMFQPLKALGASLLALVVWCSTAHASAIPKGIEVSSHMQQRVSSYTAVKGDTCTGVVKENVVAAGRVVIAKNTPVVFTIKEARKARGHETHGWLRIQQASTVDVNNQPVLLEADFSTGKRFATPNWKLIAIDILTLGLSTRATRKLAPGREAIIEPETPLLLHTL